MANLPLFSDLTTVPEFEFVEIKTIGPDVRMILKPRG
jgi:hypothetical protein